MKKHPLINYQYTSLLLLLNVLLYCSSCQKLNSDTKKITTGNPTLDTLVNLNVPSGFQYKTVQLVTLNITILAPDNSPVKKNRVNILTAPIASGGTVLYSSFTDDNGKITGNINLPTYLTKVIVDPAYHGVIQNAGVSIVGQTVLCTLGGSNGYSGNVIPEPSVYLGQRSMETMTTHPPYSFMGTFDSQGKPNYFDPTNTPISQQLLSWLNYSLPEGVNVAKSHPPYLYNNIETNVHLTALSDVWFTFVSEGAGYRSAIAYFTYPTNAPPQTTADIDSLHIVLPNASFLGSGGELVSGNRVKLGRFSAGTSIGFCLISNAWNGTTVGNGIADLYSLDYLNPEATASLQRHTVMLYDNVDSLFLISFEDMRRDNPSCDNDFNDVIFHITSNPVTAVSTINVNPVDRPVDTDGDGVSDTYDQFPTDPTRAYINYYPGQNVYSNVAFEDNWPYLGDYDMNDLVVGYNYTFINNAQNNTVSMTAKYIIRAAGSYYHNGFGVEFPFAASYVSSVSGTRVNGSDVVTFASNGCESGQSNAVIIPFDDAFAEMNTTTGFNTYLTGQYLLPDTISMTINFTTPLSASTMGNAPFNPFIIINKTRGREAHLAGNPPTQLADNRLFKTGEDNTSLSNHVYYVTTDNLPWALSFPSTFSYPIEGVAINAAYIHFVPWAQSGGTNYTNWYIDPSNMVTNNIFNK